MCGIAAPAPEQLSIAPTQYGAAPGAMLLLYGRVGAAIAAVELRFEDGRSERLPVHQGWVLYQVAPADLAPGRKPVEPAGLVAKARS